MRTQAGTRVEASVRRQGQRPLVSSTPFPEVGVVLRALPRDHADNRSKAYVELDVFVPRFYVTLKNVPMAQPAGYQSSDGEEFLPAGLPGQVVEPLTDAKLAGAPRCIVDFLGGHSPVVRAFLPFAPSKPGYGVAVADGRARKMRWRGTTVTIADNGAVTVQANAGANVNVTGANVVVNGGTLGAARDTDPVHLDYSAANAAWAAFFSAVATQLDGLPGGGGQTALYNAAKAAGMDGEIDGGSSTVKVG